MDGLFRKEFLVLSPLFGTVVAISFDVGYFSKLDINLFNVFSVSEHIVFALQLLPVVVLASMIVIVSSLAEGYLKDKKVNRRADWVLMGILLSTVILAAIASAYFRTFFLIFIVCVGVLTIGLVGSSLFYSRRILQPNVIPTVAAMLIVVGAVTLGLDTASRHQSNRNYNYLIRTVTTDINGRVLRSGDRGLLIFEQQSRALMLLPWNEIKQVTEKKTVLAPRDSADDPI
jgi:hypothetical protein